jgi:hypothetical protein
MARKTTVEEARGKPGVSRSDGLPRSLAKLERKRACAAAGPQLHTQRICTGRSGFCGKSKPSLASHRISGGTTRIQCPSPIVLGSFDVYIPRLPASCRAASLKPDLVWLFMAYKKLDGVLVTSVTNPRILPCPKTHSTALHG